MLFLNERTNKPQNNKEIEPNTTQTEEFCSESCFFFCLVFHNVAGTTFLYGMLFFIGNKLKEHSTQHVRHMTLKQLEADNPMKSNDLFAFSPDVPFIPHHYAF